MAWEDSRVDGEELLVDLDSAEFVDDPYPLFARLRQRGGLSRGTSGWVSCRHADVVEFLTGDRVTSRAPDIEEVAEHNPIHGTCCHWSRQSTRVYAPWLRTISRRERSPRSLP
jgi:cytochrome P450